MNTSALSLYQLLAAAKLHKPPSDRFLTVLANHLELNGPNAEAQVIQILANLISNVENDIASLSLEDSMKAHLRRHIAPFNGIKNFSQVHFDIKAAQAHFLKPENLNGLTDLHLALTGHIETNSIGNDAKELAEQFKSIRDQILEADLPESLKVVLHKRTGQIASILEHFYAFGPQALQEELEGLIGAMVVHPPAKGSSASKLFKGLAALAVAGLVVLTTVDNSLEKLVSIAENATKLVEVMDETTADEPEDTVGPSSEEANKAP